MFRTGIIFAILSLVCIDCFAVLQVSSGSAPGTYCYSECTDSGVCPVVGVCNCGDYTNISGMSTCPTPYMNTGSECRLGTDYRGASVFCYDGGEHACNYCNCGGNMPTYYEQWLAVPSDSTRASRIVHNRDISYNMCFELSTSYEYACNARNYWVSGSHYTLVCAPCPALGLPGGGTSNGITAIGNKGPVTDCYAIPGNPYADTSGNFSFSSTCYASP